MNVKVLLAGVVLCSGVAQAQAPSAAPAVRVAGGQTMQKMKFDGHDAWRLSDGQSEAIIVPSMGRVMRFGRVGGLNWLWNAPPGQYRLNNWSNYGGDKTWPAPQSQWEGMSGGKGWPPPSAWDGAPHVAGTKNGKLWMVSPVQKGLGARIIRQFWFEPNGDFVIEQAAEKTQGDPTYFSLWSVIQIIPPEAMFLPLNPNSPYKNNFAWIYKPKVDVNVQIATPGLLRVLPSVGTDANNFKIGTDAAMPAAVAVRDGWAFVARSNKPGGEYPDGMLGAGFPIELWNMGPKDVHYNELELLSPLRLYKKGSRWKHTIRWSVHQLPAKDINSPLMAAAIEKIIGE